MPALSFSPVWRALTLVGVAAVSMLACKPAEEQEEPPPPVAADDAADAFARQICAGLYSCSCTVAGDFGSESQCIDELSADFRSSIDTVLAAGGTWNEACAGQMVAAWADWECLGPASANAKARFDARSCPILKGTLGAGADCSRSQLGDDCSEGLTCLSGVCMDAVAPIPTGSVCEFDWDELPCVSGSYCAYDTAAQTQICKVLPKLDDPCNPNEDYLCGPSSLDLVCDVDTQKCVSAPGEGEACFDGFLCGPGNYCDGGKDFTCQARFELGDGCGADAVCPADASCIGNICQADPAAICSYAYFF